MENDIEDLKKQMTNKVDSSFFEDELDRLKNLLNQIAS